MAFGPFKSRLLCFAPIKQDVAVAPDAPVPVWELKVLSLEEIHATAAQPTAGQPAARGGSARQARQESREPEERNPPPLIRRPDFSAPT